MYTYWNCLHLVWELGSHQGRSSRECLCHDLLNRTPFLKSKQYPFNRPTFLLTDLGSCATETVSPQSRARCRTRPALQTRASPLGCTAVHGLLISDRLATEGGYQSCLANLPNRLGTLLFGCTAVHGLLADDRRATEKICQSCTR